ncbi:MAG: type III-A CRISPR-associated RAMP protein Csm5 [Zhaonellaceae bacterium]|nr:type III-A CRISPR-associated RAMP protein Csm5 [Clostridia bacterium]
MKYGHLERAKVTLKALSPVFIGSGESLTKKEYIFDPAKGLVHIPDLTKLIGFLKQRSLLPRYEKYLIHPRNNDLRIFLQECNIGEKDYAAFIRYSIEAGEAAKANNFREVLTFVKGPEGKPYIPGSSLKGAIRTALAAKLMQNGNWSNLRNSIEAGADNFRGLRTYLKQESNKTEQYVFGRLEIKDPKDPARSIPAPINDVMRGIQVSDSTPLEYDNLILTGKYERKPDGTVKVLPIFRECLQPGSKAHFIMTLEIPILAKAGITLEFIEEALHAFADQHYAVFEEHFKELPQDAPLAAEKGVDIILGGGAGYVSKTITYNLFPERKKALSLVTKILDKQFPNHKHTKDSSIYKVSPRILKTAMYQNCYYQMGRCELIFN